MITYNKLIEFYTFEKQLREFIKNTPFGRFLSDRRLKFENSVDYELMNLQMYSEKGNIILAVNEKGVILGLIGFHFSAWDTDIFLKRMAIIQYFLVKEVGVNTEKDIANHLLSLFHQWIKAKAISIVVTKLDTQYFVPILTLQQNGFILYECITFRSIDAHRVDKFIGEGIQYRYAVESDKETLKKISLKNTFTKSHFYLDTNFEIERVELMYSRWIENALNSTQKVIIVEYKNKIAGVFIYELVDHTSILNRKFGVWKSAFIDNNFRDKGIGLQLFKATLQSCINDGVDIVDSTLVEKNIISQGFHDKLGFRLINTLYTLHKWFD